MAQWEEKLSNHAIHTTLHNLTEAMNSDEIASEDITVMEHVERIAQLVSYAKIRLSNSIPPLINHGHLNNANSHIQNVLNEVNAYISNGNTGHLNNTASHIDNAMAQLNALPAPPQPLIEESFTNSLHQFKTIIEKSFEEIQAAKDELAHSIENVSSSSEEQQEAIRQLATQVDEQKSHIEESLSEFTNRYENFEEESSKQLQEKVSEAESQVEELVAKQELAHKEQLSDQEKKAGATLKTLSQKQKEASDLVQVIGNIGITGNYQNNANLEKASADKWRNIALFLMIGMVAVIALTIGLSAANGFDWKLALFRIGAALVLAVPATYAARESAKHRALEIHNRRAELELASLDPFLEKMPEDVRTKVKEGLTEKFFGLNTIEAKHEEPVSYSALYDLLKTAISKK